MGNLMKQEVTAVHRVGITACVHGPQEEELKMEVLCGQYAVATPSCEWMRHEDMVSS